MKNLITLSFLFIYSIVVAQVGDKHDYIWVLGYDVDVSTPEGQGNLFDFNGDTLEVSFLVKDMNIDFTHASIADTAGNLLFYTNGCYIADASHEMMENGDEINYQSNANLAVTIGLDVEKSEKVSEVHAGGDFTCVLTTIGQVYCFGGNSGGQIGMSDTTGKI